MNIANIVKLKCMRKADTNTNKWEKFVKNYSIKKEDQHNNSLHITGTETISMVEAMAALGFAMN